MDDQENNWEQEARLSTKNKNVVDRILITERLPLNPSRKRLLGYEEDDVVTYYSKSQLHSKEAFMKVEEAMKESRSKLTVVMSANNSSTSNLKYMRLANKLSHSFKIVADDQFTGDTGLVVIKK